MNITCYEIENIDWCDYPDFCDAYVAYAEIDDKPATEEQLDLINEDTDLVYELVTEWIH